MAAQNNSIDSIHSVAVCFNAQTSWSPLWHKYLFLKENLTIENLATFGCIVKLQYWDAINLAKLNNQAVEDL